MWDVKNVSFLHWLFRGKPFLLLLFPEKYSHDLYLLSSLKDTWFNHSPLLCSLVHKIHIVLAVQKWSVFFLVGKEARGNEFLKWEQFLFSSFEFHFHPESKNSQAPDHLPFFPTWENHNWTANFAQCYLMCEYAVYQWVLPSIWSLHIFK